MGGSVASCPQKEAPADDEAEKTTAPQPQPDPCANQLTTPREFNPTAPEPSP